MAGSSSGARSRATFTWASSNPSTPGNLFDEQPGARVFDEQPGARVGDGSRPTHPRATSRSRSAIRTTVRLRAGF
ncbi:hypothetical protein ACFPM0_19510 [Pseudonocardia sulfidoxydans]|uniref:hypothetical protein n=1 Tax=Pseudonocardia sulfidoxydans TaxID=54011 RepID=UPI0036205A39